MQFNAVPPTMMHVDLNSCFATVEQQANPLFRGKPLVVAAYAQKNGCILAASREAKKLGIKTGMAVGDGQQIYRKLIVLPPDPEKYRFINHKLRDLLQEYSCDMSVESIDEMVVSFKGAPSMSGIADRYISRRMQHVGEEIKQRIRDEIGEWLTVSIGIAPNKYLAKVASGLHKPDGLDVIIGENIEDIFRAMELEDLCGIKTGIATRLRYYGINTPLDLYYAKPEQLYGALHSIVGFQWWYRLHGYEDGSRYKAFGSSEDDQKTFGQSHALGTFYTPQDVGLHQVLAQLVAKMARRLRQADCTAAGIYVSCFYADHTHWGHGQKTHSVMTLDTDFYERMSKLLLQAPVQPVRILAIGCFDLVHHMHQESLFADVQRQERIMKAIDTIHDRWGDGTVTSARVLGSKLKVLDRIAFGRVRELQKPN